MELKNYLKYNPETGEIIWIDKPGKRVQIGNIAGGLNTSKNQGYIQIRFNKKLYLAHRIAWYLHYGVWPQNYIDHINGIRTDNKISNLRDVTVKENNNNPNNIRSRYRRKCHD